MVNFWANCTQAPRDTQQIGMVVPTLYSSVADPDPDLSDPYFLGLRDLDTDPLVKRYGSGSFFHQAKIVKKTLIPTVL